MCKLTKGFHSFPLLAAGFAAGLTADVVESEEDVMLLMHVDRKLNFHLPKKKEFTQFSKYSYTFLCLKARRFLCVRSKYTFSHK